MLPKGTLSCIFCDPPESTHSGEYSSATQGNLAIQPGNDATWRGELNERVQAYRAKRRKPADDEAQTELPFLRQEELPEAISVQLDELSSDRKRIEDDFAFTIAIGRSAKRKEVELETQYFIDVSLPPKEIEENPSKMSATVLPQEGGVYPAATLYERRSAAWIDLACLSFAYGAFLTLFGSLGGHFAFSKLNAALYFFTFAFVYLQYFGLFTIFGGTTPGMMIRGLQVATFSGEEPTLRHLLVRALGYFLSAGTLFLGFLWALWDEDGLTWHDRISKTYLRAPEPLA